MLRLIPVAKNQCDFIPVHGWIGFHCATFFFFLKVHLLERLDSGGQGVELGSSRGEITRSMIHCPNATPGWSQEPALWVSGTQVLELSAASQTALGGSWTGSTASGTCTSTSEWDTAVRAGASPAGLITCLSGSSPVLANEQLLSLQIRHLPHALNFWNSG